MKQYAIVEKNDHDDVVSRHKNLDLAWTNFDRLYDGTVGVLTHRVIDMVNGYVVDRDGGRVDTRY